MGWKPHLGWVNDNSGKKDTFVGCYIKHNTSQVLASGTFDLVEYDTIVTNPQGSYNTASFLYRAVFPGWYMIGTSLETQIQVSATDNWSLRLEKNGSGVDIIARGYFGINATQFFNYNVTTLFPLKVGDTVGVQMRFSRTNAASLSGVQDRNFLYVVYVGDGTDFI